MNLRIHFLPSLFPSRPFQGARVRTLSAFTLIELIGVIAIIGILASIIAPSVFKSIDMAEVRAEGRTLSNFADQIKLYVQKNTTPPTTANWASPAGPIVPNVDVSAASITTNRRNRLRVYLTDPDPAYPIPRRAIFLSVVNANPTLALPTQAAMVMIGPTSTFQTLWDTPDNTVPTTVNGWLGWGAWAPASYPNAEQYLVIQRVNLASYLSAINIRLNNISPKTASYKTTHLGVPNPVATGVPITPPPVSVLGLVPGDRLDLYDNLNVLNYSYFVISPGRNFDFDGTNWKAP